MKPRQLAVLSLAVLAVAAIALVGERAGQIAKPGGATIRVLFDYSLEKEKRALVEPLVAAFNDQNVNLDGRRIEVVAQQTGIRRSADRDRARAAAARRVVAVDLALGAAAQLPRRPRASRRRTTRCSCARRS